MSRPVFFHEDAEEEFNAAFEWYRIRSERAAGRFLDEVAHAIERIQDAPQQFPQISSIARRAMLHRFPFAVVFRETGEELHILAVAHARRRPFYWRDRDRK